MDQDRSTLFLCQNGGSTSEDDEARLVKAQVSPLHILLVPEMPTPELLFGVKSSVILIKCRSMSYDGGGQALNLVHEVDTYTSGSGSNTMSPKDKTENQWTPLSSVNV